MAVATPLSAVDAFKAANWTNGTANGLTPNQNMASVINQPGNTTKTTATPYITPGGTTDYHISGRPDTPAPAPSGGGFVPVGKLGDTTNTNNTGGVAASTTAAPSTGGQTPPQSNTGYKPPAYDAAAIAASRIAQQRAALQGSVNAYDAQRKAGFDYAQKTLLGNRSLLQFDNSNRGDQFGGSAREDLFRLQRSQNQEDTYANTQYQNDIAASDAKLQAFDAGAAGQQQDIQNQLEQQQFQNNISQAPYTGQFNGQQTQQAQAQGFNQNLQTDQFNNQAQNQQFNQNLQTNQFNNQVQNQNFNQNMQVQQFAYQQTRDSIKDQQYQQTFDLNVKQQGLEYALKQATLANQITNDQAQRAIGYMNAQTSQQNASTSATNSANSQANVQADNQRADLTSAAKTYQDTFSNLQSLYTAKDPYTGTISVTNPQQLRAAILAKNFDDQTTIKMLSDFGLPIH